MKHLTVSDDHHEAIRLLAKEKRNKLDNTTELMLEGNPEFMAKLDIVRKRRKNAT